MDTIIFQSIYFSFIIYFIKYNKNNKNIRGTYRYVPIIFNQRFFFKLLYFFISEKFYDF